MCNALIPFVSVSVIGLVAGAAAAQSPFSLPDSPAAAIGQGGESASVPTAVSQGNAFLPAPAQFGVALPAAPVAEAMESFTPPPAAAFAPTGAVPEPLTIAAAMDAERFQLSRKAVMTVQDASEDAAAMQESADAPDDASFLWDGFLTGQKGFDDFVHSVSSPLYFFNPFIDTHANFCYIWNKFPDGSPLKGGDLSVWAVQVFVALTEKLQLTATSDGYSRIRARALQPAEGWNDIALGLKYNLIANQDEQYLLSTGLSWKLSNGTAKTLHGGVDELIPYVTAAKGYGKFHVIGTVGGRLPMDDEMGNYILYEDLHFDYELLENFYPLLEFHALQYLSNGSRLPFGVGGLDYANIGANDVRGNSVFWGDVGFRWKLNENIEFGATYGFPISNPNNSILDDRVTVSVIIGL